MKFEKFSLPSPQLQFMLKRKQQWWTPASPVLFSPHLGIRAQRGGLPSVWTDVFGYRSRQFILRHEHSCRKHYGRTRNPRVVHTQALYSGTALPNTTEPSSIACQHGGSSISYTDTTKETSRPHHLRAGSINNWYVKISVKLSRIGIKVCQP
jgi:hypothetical protein